MQATFDQPNLKVLTLTTYEKHFLEAVKSQDSTTVLFYKEDTSTITISFSWENFIIVVPVKKSDIFELYSQQDFHTADVTAGAPKSDDLPHIIKFKTEYLVDRGVREE